VIGAIASSAAVLVPSAAAIGSGDSGVSGVLRSTCAQARHCTREPVTVADVVIRERGSGRKVRRLHARGGRFRASLAPGSYTLTATARGGSPTAHATADVRAHRFVVVVLVFGGRTPDSGYHFRGMVRGPAPP
jgi:hypothetical protein